MVLLFIYGDIHITDLIWSQRGKNCEQDVAATELFLQLRLKYDNLFMDKKTCKNNIWKEISNKMAEAGYIISENPKLAAEKCRQKFQNLTKLYINHINHMNKTGEQQKLPPNHFGILHDILGQKHKVKPSCLIDSLNESEKCIPNNLEYVDEAMPTHGTDESVLNISNQSVNNDSQIENVNSVNPASATDLNSKPGPSKRFQNVKTTIRPQKTSVVTLLKEINQENNTTADKQFNKLISVLEIQNNLLKEQNKQREEFLKILKDKKERNKKRKHESSDSD